MERHTPVSEQAPATWPHPAEKQPAVIWAGLGDQGS